MQRLFFLLVLLFLTSACTSVNVKHDFDASADFASYSSFGWISDKPLIKAVSQPINPMFEGRAMAAIKGELESKGFRFESDPDKADFVVSFTIGTREKMQVNHYPPAYRSGWAWGGPYYQQVDVRNYLEGTLAIDLFDVDRRQPVWHGWAVKSVSARDRTKMASVVKEVVASILVNFPP